MYKVTIGLEVHCELTTISKCFSSGKNEYNMSPNMDLSVVDLGFPGILPVLNKEALDSAIKVSCALNCDIANKIMFDRKNYFYPDLPKGYQITQNNSPVGTNGYLDIYVNGEVKRIDIHDLHLEEDTASLDHFKDYSLINYNRAGIPLIEIVTEPCMHSVEEAISFLESLRSLIIYTGVSTARSDRGQMRCDVNVSLSETDDLGTKVEVKNINSFYNVRETILYEIKRQTELLSKGEKIAQETRRLDSSDFKTYTMRSKEDAIDYKYFIEPNIPVINLTDEYISNIRNSLPEFAFDRIKKYTSLEIPFIDAETLVKDKGVSDFFEECLKLKCNPKKACNLITTKILGLMNKENLSISDIYFKPDMILELLELVENGKITSNQAKEIFNLVIENKKRPQDIATEYNMVALDDENAIDALVKEVIDENPQVVTDYKNGRTNMLGYLVGQVIKKSGGRANPSIAKEKVLKCIN